MSKEAESTWCGDDDDDDDKFIFMHSDSQLPYDLLDIM